MARDPYTGASSDLGPLFNKPLARTSDPLPSHLAAKEIRSTGAHGRQCDEVEAALREYIELYGTAPTTRELANDDPGVTHIYGRRLSDLADAGRVKRCAQRKCRFGPTKATTWETVR